MDKRYQVFISSTYTDLTVERQRVLQTLLQMDCIPTGMELFPAADQEQIEFIKKIIDDCDYYILIIGGRYGTTTDEGISYTELEFDYAVSQGLHIIAFVHGDPNSIPAGKSELHPDTRKRLEEFIEKVSRDRLVKKWSSAEELPGLVALSLTRAIKAFPAIGWVRANAVSNSDLLEQINALRNKNEELQLELASVPSTVVIDSQDISSGDERIPVKIIYQEKYESMTFKHESEVSWNQIISFLGPHLLQHINEDTINSQLAMSILNTIGVDANSFYTKKIDDEIFQTIKVQLLALGWIDIKPLTTKANTVALFWILTDLGRKKMLMTRSIKSQGSAQKADK